MTHPQWRLPHSHQAELHGALDRNTVPALWQALQQWEPSVPQVELSLQYVQRIDSAGMVLLLHLIEHAKKRNCHIMLSFVPEQLVMLFKLSNVEAMLAEHK